MVGKFVPTLDDEGWIRYSSRTKLDRLLSDFFCADGAQSALYYDVLKTFQVIQASNLTDVTNMRSDMEDYLNSYLKPYFDAVSVELSYCSIDGKVINTSELEGLDRIGFYLQCTVKDSNEVIKLDKPAIYENGKFQYVLDAFNNGEAAIKV